MWLYKCTQRERYLPIPKISSKQVLAITLGIRVLCRPLSALWGSIYRGIIFLENFFSPRQATNSAAVTIPFSSWSGVGGGGWGRQEGGRASRQQQQ